MIFSIFSSSLFYIITVPHTMIIRYTWLYFKFVIGINTKNKRRKVTGNLQIDIGDLVRHMRRDICIYSVRKVTQKNNIIRQIKITR